MERNKISENKIINILEKSETHYAGGITITRQKMIKSSREQSERIIFLDIHFFDY